MHDLEIDTELLAEEPEVEGLLVGALVEMVDLVDMDDIGADQTVQA